MRLNYFFLWLAYAIVITILISDQLIVPGSLKIVRLIGNSILILSIIILLLPFYYLKKYGRVMADQPYYQTNAVVKRGVYSIVRHPQYLGYMLLAVGFTARSQHILMILLGLLTVLFFNIHVHSEEKYCLEKFGSDYRLYMDRVPKFNFIIGLYRLLFYR